MKITSYGIIRCDNTQDLANRIVKYMESGWQPLGGLAYLPNGRCAQAIVKYDGD